MKNSNFGQALGDLKVTNKIDQLEDQYNEQNLQRMPYSSFFKKCDASPTASASVVKRKHQINNDAQQKNSPVNVNYSKKLLLTKHATNQPLQCQIEAQKLEVKQSLYNDLKESQIQQKVVKNHQQFHVQQQTKQNQQLSRNNSSSFIVQNSNPMAAALNQEAQSNIQFSLANSIHGIPLSQLQSHLQQIQSYQEKQYQMQLPQNSLPAQNQISPLFQNFVDNNAAGIQQNISPTNYNNLKFSNKQNTINSINIHQQAGANQQKWSPSINNCWQSQKTENARRSLLPDQSFQGLHSQGMHQGPVAIKIEDMNFAIKNYMMQQLSINNDILYANLIEDKSSSQHIKLPNRQSVKSGIFQGSSKSPPPVSNRTYQSNQQLLMPPQQSNLCQPVSTALSGFAHKNQIQSSMMGPAGSNQSVNLQRITIDNFILKAPKNDNYNSDQSLESVEEGAQEDEQSNSSESSFSSIDSSQIKMEAAKRNQTIGAGLMINNQESSYFENDPTYLGGDKIREQSIKPLTFQEGKHSQPRSYKQKLDHQQQESKQIDNEEQNNNHNKVIRLNQNQNHDQEVQHCLNNNGEFKHSKNNLLLNQKRDGTMKRKDESSRSLANHVKQALLKQSDKSLVQYLPASNLIQVDSSNNLSQLTPLDPCDQESVSEKLMQKLLDYKLCKSVMERK